MARPRKGVFRAGTSNIVVPGNKQSFPEEFQAGTRLCYYASLFNSLEVNSSFYKIPMARTFARWATEVPEDFRFTIKLWKGITHVKDLVFNPADIDRFMEPANSLGNKKGCLLIQFPASITYSYKKQVRQILQKIARRDPGNGWRKAVEFRHKSWYNDDTYTLLDKYQSSLVLHDMPASMPTTLNPAAPFVFFRFHGMAGDYRGSYSDHYLQVKAVEANKWLKKGLDVYAYFNNTIGDAYNNALLLGKCVEEI